MVEVWLVAQERRVERRPVTLVRSCVWMGWCECPKREPRPRVRVGAVKRPWCKGWSEVA